MPEITVYTRTTCAPCRALKTWLTNKGIPYKEQSVDDDPTIMDMLIEKTGYMMVPVTKIGERYIPGANIASINNLLLDNQA
jgi:glutaredoxin